jgi:hypothetical protein
MTDSDLACLEDGTARQRRGSRTREMKRKRAAYFMRRHMMTPLTAYH